MIFNEHLRLKGQHAFLGASKPHWLGYDDEKFDRVWLMRSAAQRGTELHAHAAESIRLGVKLQGRTTIAQYVNDAIGYRMTPEQVLYYSENCYGTPDAISFRRNLLRIHDLKNGRIPGMMTQLEVYAALFCLEYRFKPFDIQMLLRIYQNDEINAVEADPDRIAHIMDKIITLDRRINELRMEAE